MPILGPVALLGTFCDFLVFQVGHPDSCCYFVLSKVMLNKLLWGVQPNELDTVTICFV